MAALFRKPLLHQPLHPLLSPLRSGDNHLTAQRHDPSKELVTHRHVYACGEPFVIYRVHPGVLAELVDDDICHLVFAFQGYGLYLSAEHPEILLTPLRLVLLIERAFTLTSLIRKLNLSHLIHAKMPNLVLIMIIPNQIIPLIIKMQRPWTHIVKRPVPAELLFALNVPAEVFEADGLVLAYRIVKGIDGVVDAFIHIFDAPCHLHLAVEELCIIYADVTFKLLDQLPGLLLGDELRGLDCIHQELQLSDLKCPVAAVIQRLRAVTLFDYFYPIIIKSSQILINTLPLCQNIMLRELRKYFGHGKSVSVICLLLHYFRQIKKLKLLIFPLHNGLPLYSGKPAFSLRFSLYLWSHNHVLIVPHFEALYKGL